MEKSKVVDLEQMGTGLQSNGAVQRIYTALDPNDDGTWDVVTIVETTLDLDPDSAEHRPDAYDRLVQDIESGLRSGQLWGRVKIKSV